MDNFQIKANTSYLNNLRVVATISVILLHVVAPLVYKFNSISFANWFTANVIDSLVRFSVPIFVMITGALLLPKTYELNDYFKKRLTRIIYPFLFWIIVYSIHALLILKNGFQLPILKIITISSSSFGYKTTYHFWYIYMIIGIYLFIPMLSKWIKNAQEKEILYLLALWLIIVTIAQPLFLNLKIDFYIRYFGGFFGYIILGYYLSIKNFGNVKNIKTISFFIFLFGVVITIFGTYFLSKFSGHFRVDLYTYFSPNVIIAATGLFLFLKHSNISNIKANYAIKAINQQSFGIYFVHVLVLFWLNRFGLNGNVFGPAIGIPLTTLACLIISFLLIYLLKKLGLNKVVG